MMARDNGLSPTVTIPSVSPPDIGRLLDAGALGFCLCHAESTEQVEALVRAMKYPECRPTQRRRRARPAGGSVGMPGSG